MMARPYCLVVALLLLAEASSHGEGVSNPGFVVRVTRKGLDYARQYGMATLKKEMATINLPDLSGSFKVGWMGSMSYEFKSLRILNFLLRNSDLSLRPGKGVTASLSNNYVSIAGNWKVKKGFITLQGTFDLSVDDVSISISLNVGKDPSGRPTASVDDCSNSVGQVSIHTSGNLSWLLNVFHERIENKLKNILKQEICGIIRQSTTTHLEPYLQTLPVTLMIDKVAGIDYSLVGAPWVTSEGLDTPFKGEFFCQSQCSPVPLDAPPIGLSQEHDRMTYFAVSQYVFNTASQVYYQAGYMNFTIRNEHIPLDFPIQLHTKSLGAVIPQLSRLYPNTELELEMSPEAAPFLKFSPGNVTLIPVMNIQAFALLPNSSDRKPLFHLRARTNISTTISVRSGRVLGSLTPGSKLKLELIHSNINFFNVELLETIFNYYATYLIYPTLNAKLEEGFPLPLPRDTYLNSLELQIHKNFLLIAANID
ncbi:lipopolysaccharide-binding protein-like [Molossus molossus]|uniref:lipopolysaccharide-binding protein-like n=1 Tax=Molossus molossus TaxID=27622 RepID=UPI001746B2D1|nr:lipopolysaccharide-binding protein-like [Molossus molossus]